MSQELRDRVLRDALHAVLDAGLTRGDVVIEETPPEWHQAAQLARQSVAMHRLLEDALGRWQTRVLGFEDIPSEAVISWLVDWLLDVERVLDAAKPRPHEPTKMLRAFVSASMDLDRAITQKAGDCQRELARFRIIMEQARQMVSGEVPDLSDPGENVVKFDGPK